MAIQSEASGISSTELPSSQCNTPFNVVLSLPAEALRRACRSLPMAWLVAAIIARRPDTDTVAPLAWLAWPKHTIGCFGHIDQVCMSRTVTHPDSNRRNLETGMEDAWRPCPRAGRGCCQARAIGCSAAACGDGASSPELANG